MGLFVFFKDVSALLFLQCGTQKGVDVRPADRDPVAIQGLQQGWTWKKKHFFLNSDISGI